MDISYRKDTYQTYMVIKGTDTEETDDEERMLSNQQSPVLLPFHVRQLNEEKDYYYDVTGKLDFRSYLEKHQADAALIEIMVRFLVKIYQTIDEYLLNPDSLLLDIAYLYVNIDEKQLFAAYVPGLKSDFNENIHQLSCCLLENADHRDKEGVLLVYDLYKTVRREDFVPELLMNLCLKKEVCCEEMGDISKAEKEKEYGEKEYREKEYKEKEYKEKASDQTSYEKRKKLKVYAGTVAFCLCVGILYRSGILQMMLQLAGWNADVKLLAVGMLVSIAAAGILLSRKKFQLPWPDLRKKEEEDDVWSDVEFETGGIYSFTDETETEKQAVNEGRTVILSGAGEVVRLISLNKNIAADLVLTKFPCIVGSQEGEGEVVIDAVGISRKHALIEKRQDGIYLMDLNSTNGTMINGKRLKKEEKRKLLVEDIIEFADVRYMYCGGGEVNM